MMTTDDREIDGILEFVEAVCACPDPGEYAPAVEDAKYEAILKVLSMTSAYRQHGIRNELVHTIFRRKIEMIRKASTVKELKAIEKGSVLHFNGPHSRRRLGSMVADESEGAIDRPRV